MVRGGGKHCDEKSEVRTGKGIAGCPVVFPLIFFMELHLFHCHARLVMQNTCGGPRIVQMAHKHSGLATCHEGHI